MLTRRTFLESTLFLSVVPECFAQVAFTQENASIEPFFILRSNVWRGVDFKKGKSPFPFNLTEIQVKRVINQVVVAVHKPSLAITQMLSRDAQSVGKQIVNTINAMLDQSEFKGVNTFTRQWLIAEGVCSWLQINVLYDHEFEKELNKKGGWSSLSSDEVQKRTSADPILRRKQPAAVCWGIAVTTRDVARAAGLKCDLTNGNYRGLGSLPPPQTDRNHGTVCFIFDGGIEVPADVSSHICDYQNNHKPFPRRKTNSWMVLPRLAEEWELFLATFNSDVGGEMTISGDKQNQHKYLTINYTEWAGRDTNYLKLLLQQYQVWEKNQEM